MYINELRIDDFGCFRNARLENLAEDLVVIGGPQRAGKTTFMQALRQFPSGVGRDDGIPPATDQYRIDAEVTHEQQRYRYVLNGHARPSVSPIGDGPQVDAEDIFGPVTERQYSNLYTISLDELRRLPPGIEDPEDLARVLLGGAYGDIAEIPALKESFGDQAYEIGLSRGDPTTKTSKLNDPYQTIREGIRARDEASKQVDEYQSVTQELSEKRSEQAEIEKEITSRQRSRDRLNILRELFDPIRRLETLNARLSDVAFESIEEFPTHLADRLDHFEAQFETATTALNEAQREFEQQAVIDTTDEYYRWLLEHETKLEALIEDRKLWTKTNKELAEEKTTLEETRRSIEREISSLHSDWGESFDHIDAIETSAVDTARVADLASTIEQLQGKRAELQTDIDAAQTRKQELESKLAEMEEEHDESKEITIPKRKPAIVASVAIAVGTGAGIVATPLVGGVAGLVLLAVGLYAIDSTVAVETTVDADPYREVKGQLTTLEADIQADSKQRSEVAEQATETQEELTELVTELGLPESLPPSEVAAFYEQVVELDENINGYREKRTEWEERTEDLATELEEVATLLAEVTDTSWTATEPLTDASDLLATVETVAADLELARDVRHAERERVECIESIASVVTAWDEERSIDADTNDREVLQQVKAFNDEAERVNEIQDLIQEREQLETQVSTRIESPSAQEAFEPLRSDDEPWIDVVHSAATEYADTDAIADEIRNQNTKIEDLESKRDSLQETCIGLEKQQEVLASEDDLRNARAKIEEGRVEFERLGESYAVNRIAETMLTQLHERLMQDVVHSLVDDASEMFSEITQEYDGIELEGDVQDLRFHALREGQPDHGVGELSRATAEQLFLAVRLARIQQTDVSLPVILDDAATNFDPNHMTRVFNVIEKLTTTNQVFFLTCHPECVRITTSNDLSVQYWSLDSGQFTRRETADILEQQLTAD